jgi:hypothetical protein
VLSLRPFNSRNKTFLDGTLVSNILINTTQVATDTWGNTATSTRTVIVQSASSSPSIQ